jgi:hypothetical protein
MIKHWLITDNAPVEVMVKEIVYRCNFSSVQPLTVPDDKINGRDIYSPLALEASKV